VRRRVAAALLAAAALLLPALAAAASLQVVTGTMQAGGLLHGLCQPGDRVTLNGTEIPVAPDGRFIVGMGPEGAPRLDLVATSADGAQARISLSVGAREYQTQRIDSLPQDKVTPDPAMLERIRRDAEAVKAARAALTNETGFDQKLRWPVKGTITGVYGTRRILNGEPRQPHFGVDVAAPAGTPVVAPADGAVTLAADLVLTGNTVVVDHGLGLSTTYAHLATVAVRPGERVRQGAAIGTVGATGRATGPHLHWGLDWRDVRLDPQLVAGPMPPG
jgi:murein DD-endopeptidase MepM/ murein hydrolase activator NlpD